MENVLNVLVVGCNGRMGKLVCDYLKQSQDFKIVGGYDFENKNLYNFPVYTSIEELQNHTESWFDLIIDFSNPSATMAVLEFAVTSKTPMVIATTGFTDEQENLIEKASYSIPIFKSSNMSYGANVVIELLKIATKYLPDDYEIEIHEIHHSGKKDSPSGTAILFANAIREEYEKKDNSKGIFKWIYGRIGKRKKKEIGISSSRCGKFPGKHIVIFANGNEYISIEHFAFSSNMFAEGAITAAKYLSYQSLPGMYNMQNILKL